MTNDEVYLNGEDVTTAIRSPEVTRSTRHAADCPAVRQRLVAWQHAFAGTERQVVTEGRDQGTIVFPDALKKYFLTANDEERARRRQAEQAARGDQRPLAEILQQVRDRDARDQARAIAPMIAAQDARVIDSTGLALDEIVTLMEQEIKEHLADHVPSLT